MMDYGFSVGMTKAQFMSKLSNSNATESTRKFINNFWASDKDGKITNEIELAMLQSWADGSEKVKMPVKGKGEPLHTTVFSDGSVTNLYESKSNKRKLPNDLEKHAYDRFTFSKGKYSSSACWTGEKASDTLYDLDADGYADCRSYYDNWFSVNPSDEDNNLDGKFD